MSRRRPPCPLPMRGGVSASRVFMPPGPWRTLFEFLRERFPHVPEHILEARLARGDIVDGAGMAQRADKPYQAQGWLWYYREVPDEAAVPFELKVLYRDDALIAVDKPHFLASTPGGQYLRETALTRLREQLSMPEISPMHRLDRETAGVLLFCADPDKRGAYQSLFQSRQVQKEYEAWAPWRADLALPLCRRSHLLAVPGRFVMQEAPGEPNSETHIEVQARQGEWAHYRLRPTTGRKHQLRVHMNALGITICNDRYYPIDQAMDLDDDLSRPLQLLARAIAFPDPFSGQIRRFESELELQGPTTVSASR
ncbi:pseudouridine synthase [Mesopusillimonas faecipullorum]|nr:pseudouridine synthase [Mesopusillimonas faecipullorum]